MIKWTGHYVSKSNKRSSLEKKFPEGIALEAAEEMTYFNLMACPSNKELWQLISQ